ncbi:MAG TPA: ribonucleoside-diphosphate reductase subunit alpha [Opitutales bacterium]|nr:ribonucleoside-diphosphate reductase subunit alpha [Opitutales bacterium]
MTPTYEPSATAVSPAPRVIRRTGDLVPWDASKIEIAVRKAFLATGAADSSPAEEIALSVEKRIFARHDERVSIEAIQDIVQEEIMRRGFWKVAEAYILYRAARSAERLAAAAPSIPADAEGAFFDAEGQDAIVLVTRPGGATHFWTGDDLRARITFAGKGLEVNLSAPQIEAELRRSVFAEMKEADLRATILLNAKALIERDADFATFAGRILLTYIYEEVLGWDIVQDGIASIRYAHKSAFAAYIARGIEIGRLSPELAKYDLSRLAEALDPAADMAFDYLGVQTLYDRYLLIDKTAGAHRRIETPQFFWMRVAMGLFIRETEHREEKVIELFRLYKDRLFCSSTPTLFNSGTLHSQLSSCYLYKVDDSIESIMIRGIAENAFLAKWAGGLGGSWTQVRGTGSFIKGTNGESQGVIPFLKLHNDQLVAVNQGGKRKGSGCAYLEIWHNDFEDFLELRRNTGDERRRTHDMNTASWIPDLFMKRMEERGEWSFFHSSDVPDLHETYGADFERRYVEYERKAAAGEIWTRKISAIELWKKMLKMLFETGHPWMTFKDPCNVRSPQDHVGVVHSSNLCTEITLNSGADETAVCNLGSIVLENHLKKDGGLDLEKLRRTVRVAVRALDNVIDINFYPTKAAETANSRHRPVGLGVMGLQNALHALGLYFASDAAVEFNDTFMEAIAYYAYEASSDLAKERGAYSSFKGSKWDRGILPPDSLDLLEKERGEKIDVPRGGKLDWNALREKIKLQGMRNSNVLAIAPTATIANIMGSTPCIEPTYKNLFVKSNLSGEFIVLNTHLVRDLKTWGLWNDKIRELLKYYDGELASIDAIPQELKSRYATAFGINFEWVLKAAARRQKWIDQSQSVNLWLAEPDMKVLSHMYRSAWHMGLKTTYYLRTLGASNIEKATVSIKKAAAPKAIAMAPGMEDTAAEKKAYSAAEKLVCSIKAMKDGGECEACQ